MEAVTPRHPGPLTRSEIAQVLTALAPAGQMRDEKRAAIKRLCQDRRSGVNADAHPIWDALEDFPEF